MHRLNLSLYSHRKHQSSVTYTVQVGQHQFHSCCRSSNITDRASSPRTVATDAGTSAGSAVFASVDTRAAAALADTGVLHQQTQGYYISRHSLVETICSPGTVILSLCDKQFLTVSNMNNVVLTVSNMNNVVPRNSEQPP